MMPFLHDMRTQWMLLEGGALAVGWHTRPGQRLTLCANDSQRGVGKDKKLQVGFKPRDTYWTNCPDDPEVSEYVYGRWRQWLDLEWPKDFPGDVKSSIPGLGIGGMEVHMQLGRIPKHQKLLLRGNKEAPAMNRYVSWI